MVIRPFFPSSPDIFGVSGPCVDKRIIQRFNLSRDFATVRLPPAPGWGLVLLRGVFVDVSHEHHCIVVLPVGHVLDEGIVRVFHLPLNEIELDRQQILIHVVVPLSIDLARIHGRPPFSTTVAVAISHRSVVRVRVGTACRLRRRRRRLRRLRLLRRLLRLLPGQLHQFCARSASALGGCSGTRRSCGARCVSGR